MRTSVGRRPFECCQREPTQASACDDAAWFRRRPDAQRLAGHAQAKFGSVCTEAREVFSESDNYLCVRLTSRSTARGGIRHNPDRTVVIPTGVDTSTIAPTAAPDSPTLVHVARLVDVKGTATLMRAMARVVMLVPDARLRIIGDRPLRHALSVLAEDLGISRSVTFAGALPHSDVLAEIVSAQVLVAPNETSRSGLGRASDKLRWRLARGTARRRD